MTEYDDILQMLLDTTLTKVLAGTQMMN